MHAHTRTHTHTHAHTHMHTHIHTHTHMHTHAHTYTHTHSLINTDELEPQKADIDTLFSDWKILSWKETTPDFHQTSATAMNMDTSYMQPIIKLQPLQLISVVLELAWSP